MKEQGKNSSKKSKHSSKRGLDNLSFSDKARIIFAFTIIFIFLFLIMYRNSKINESFSELNGLKTQIAKIEKENSQLEVKIQSSLNLYNVEQAAKDMLGMQKLTSSQTIYITLPKKDYIESSNGKNLEEKKGFFEKIKDALFE